MIIALQALYLFQKSLIAVFEQILEPYLRNIFFYKSTDVCLEEDNDDDVYSEYDENKGVVFFPPVYVQRYAAVSDCLMDTRWRGQLEKVIDFGCNDMSFIKYLKDIPGVTEILGVDLEPLLITLDLKHDRYSQKREKPLKITVYQGNAADPDYTLLGSDAVVSIEMIEHMLPHDLERFIHNVFGFIKPWVVVITTPNGDFNELFKALESNGLRRLDHFFEWSREQFHDWCSNIVTRYPDYSVSCKGIGPGPPGTTHLGCCSQLALFVASNYQKQTELSPNSLAIVERASNSAMSDSMDSWDMTESIENSVQSLTTYCESVPFITTPSSHIQHKNLQCDVKEEFERNYLMFEEDTFCIRMAREWLISVYHIENVSNRLNCTNNQVKRFSKTTHKLMAKNKPDTLANARDLVGEIRHLSKVATLDTEETIWKNINWGEDAPYWNKYYKIMKEYSYPFAARSDESRILEVISEEITRLMYTSGEDSFLQDDKIEIPIGYIMGLVSHITDDEYQVRELLEWNGYEVVGDTVVYTKLVENEPVDLQKDWIDVASSDWSSTDDYQSLEMLENLSEPDLFEYDLLVSLDQKILSLQRLSKRKDISFELERLVCRLVDLVQDARNGGLPPLPMLLHKLYDLLKVTEKTMTEQRRNFIGDCKKAIEFSKRYKEDLNIIISIGIEKAFKAETIVERYESIVLDSCSEQSIENLEYDFNDEFLSRQMILENMRFHDTDNKIILQSYDSLIEEYELKDVNYKETDKVDTTTCILSTQHILSRSDEIAKWRCNKSNECLQRNNNDEVIVIKAKSIRKRQSKFREHKKKLKHKRYGKIRRLTSFAPAGYIKYFKNKIIRYQQKVKMHKEENCYVSISKSIRPIPSSLMNLFNLSQNDIEVNQKSFIGDMDCYEQSSFITVKHKEVTNLKSTDAEPNIDKSENKSVESKVTKSVSCHEETKVKENIELTSVFFTHDIDEPSTSDGIRHIGADIQCRPDDVMDLSHALSALNITPKIQHTELKIKASITDFQNTIGTNTSNEAIDICKSFRKEYVLGHQNDQEIINEQRYKKQSLENNDTTKKFYANKVSIKRSSLSYGGIYVHCYRNSNSEDIVYQGKWQKGISKNVTKKTPLVHYRRRREIIVKKKIIITEKTLNKCNPAPDNKEYKRRISYRNVVPINVAQRKPEKHSCHDISDTKKKIRHVRSVKPTIGMKPLETYTPVTKFIDTSHIFDIKNYIPAYLQRRINKYSTNKKLNLNLNIVLNTYNERKQLDEIQLKTSGNKQTAKRKLTYLRKIPTYQVYRNEIDKDKMEVRGAEVDKPKKFILASSSTHIPCSSSSNNNVSFRIKNNSIVGHSSKKCLDNYKPGNYTNRIKRVRKLNSIKSLETTKAENGEPRNMETEIPLDVSFDVEVTEISNDFNFSNTRLPNFKEAKNAYEINNNQTSEIDSAFDKTERNDEDVQEDADDNVEEQIRCLIDETLSYIARCPTTDNKDGACKLDQFPDDKQSINSDYTSTLTLPTASSAKTDIFIAQNENSSKESIEYSNIDSGVQDVEFLSPIYVASATTSKFSEYLSADNEFEDLSSLNSNSIFSLPQSPDLKENISKIENTVVPVDILMAADEDNLMDVSNIDSETRVEHASNEAPELSQRLSEDTYMSCSTQDDVHIPYWIFESDSEPDCTVMSLLEDDMNETEDSEHETEDEVEDQGVGGMGAGDGRGIHSDVSRDTSGRGTSLSGTTSLESEGTLSNRSSEQSEYNVEAQRNPENSGPANEQAVTSNDTPTSPTLPLNTDADASSLDNEYEMDSETSYNTI